MIFDARQTDAFFVDDLTFFQPNNPHTHLKYLDFQKLSKPSGKGQTSTQQRTEF